MQISEEDFECQFRETLDTLIETLADHPEIDLKEFYTMTCVLENLSFFGPVIYDLLQKSKQ
jgi:hypothetical protein